MWVTRCVSRLARICWRRHMMRKCVFFPSSIYFQVSAVTESTDNEVYKQQEKSRQLFEPPTPQGSNTSMAECSTVQPGTLLWPPAGPGFSALSHCCPVASLISLNLSASTHAPLSTVSEQEHRRSSVCYCTSVKGRCFGTLCFQEDVFPLLAQLCLARGLRRRLWYCPVYVSVS